MPALDHDHPDFARLLGDAIVALSYYFCGVPADAQPSPGGVIQGFDKLAPIYRDVTENRDGPTAERRAKYSSCGDQLHAILARIGCRNAWVNRGANHHDGDNILKLEPGAYGCPAAKLVLHDPSYRPKPGTLCLIWTSGFDAHALVALGPGSDENHMRTGNYGAGGMSPATSPGANVADSPCVWDPARMQLVVGKTRRALHCVIEPAAIVRFITAQIDLSGAPVSGELVDALGARYA